MASKDMALCECGNWTTTIVRTLAAPLFGALIRWRCEHCGRQWWTR